MAALTWREVTAPNLGNSISSVLQANQLVNQGFSGLTGALQGLYDQRRTQNTDAALATILGSEKAEDVSSLVRSAIAGGQSNGPINLAALGEAGNRQINTLLQREETTGRLADAQAERDIGQFLLPGLDQAYQTGSTADLSEELLGSRVLSRYAGALAGQARAGVDDRRTQANADRDFGLREREFAARQQQAAAELALRRQEAALRRQESGSGQFQAGSQFARRLAAEGVSAADIAARAAQEYGGSFRSAAQMEQFQAGLAAGLQSLSAPTSAQNATPVGGGFSLGGLGAERTALGNALGSIRTGQTAQVDAGFPQARLAATAAAFNKMSSQELLSQFDEKKFPGISGAQVLSEARKISSEQKIPLGTAFAAVLDSPYQSLGNKLNPFSDVAYQLDTDVASDLARQVTSFNNRGGTQARDIAVSAATADVSRIERQLNSSYNKIQAAVLSGREPSAQLLKEFRDAQEAAQGLMTNDGLSPSQVQQQLFRMGVRGVPNPNALPQLPGLGAGDFQSIRYQPPGR